VDGGSAISIFDARTGELIRKLPTGAAQPWFSPDNRWLVTTTGLRPIPGGECCLWRTDTWEKVRSTPLRRITASPAPLNISSNSTLLAVASAMNELRLMHLETLEEIATLTAPEFGIILGVKISDDGRYLTTQVTNTLHVWALHRLRHSLREIDLDWDAPTTADP
jgi:WD40 repeat protein